MKHTLTPEEESTYDALAQAAARLRKARIDADAQQQAATGKSTPGPWSWALPAGPGCSALDSFALNGPGGDGVIDAEIDGETGKPFLMVRFLADARLIAAAPDLLAQLKALATQVEMTTGLSVPPGAQAAIAKAENGGP